MNGSVKFGALPPKFRARVNEGLKVSENGHPAKFRTADSVNIMYHESDKRISLISPTTDLVHANIEGPDPEWPAAELAVRKALKLPVIHTALPRFKYHQGRKVIVLRQSRKHTSFKYEDGTRGKAPTTELSDTPQTPVATTA